MIRSRRPIPLAAALALPLAAALLAGCSSDARVLARVGNRTITAGEFHDVAVAAATRSFLPPDSAKARLLDDLIQRELLLVAAYRSAGVDSYVTRRRRAIEEDALSRALIDQLSPGNVGASDAEVRRLYAMRGTATHCQIIYAPDESTARAAYDAVARGEDFGSVAQRFDYASMLPPQGDLGFVQPGTLVSPIDRIVRDAPEGSLTGPVEAPGQGWFIVRVVSRKPHEQPAFAAEAPQLRALLMQRKQRAFILKRYQELREEYRLRVDADGLRLFFDRFGIPQQMRAMDGTPSTPQLRPTERARTLGTWDGGRGLRGAYTLGDAADDLDRGLGGRIDGSQLPSFEQWVRNRLLQRAALLEARRRHLHELPEIVRHVRETLNDELLRATYQQEVVARAVPTDAEVQAVYQQNLEAFSTLRTATLQFMTLPDSAAAARTLEHVRGAASLKDAILLASPGFSVQEETVSYPANDQLWQILQGTLLHEPLGSYLGPFRAESGWRIVQLTSRDVHVTGFDELTPEIQEGLRHEAVGAASRRRLAVFTDSLRRVVPVTVDRPLFNNLRWPLPEGLAISQD